MSKLKDRKTQIYQAAVKLIAEKGINNFSINNVCEEANISKGGFIYYFPTKEKLLEGINQYINDFSKELIEKEAKKAKTFTEAYLLGNLKGYQTDEKTAYSALINYYSEAEMEALWRHFYSDVETNLLKENSPEVTRLIIILVDGLWLRENTGYSYESIKESFEWLLKKV
ncbi:TetR/AcrR family transcriptional regulator [Pseudogracilibacillus auburnensis]|uniref:TetR/AcrR family transcriptional regulator n=1 Tax=Pseudogracilibacillus auburnensis TaxID=1494959 RepID=UPI001A970890|nr:TetR/AcrR family transcriptional regulator [Pseudogracilibacillus auburnensis]MBO1005031.1 TetR/AcrR family transcriptional regulator [Pseudogracilibacillus auburnensis]